jgi:hypothetical protein
MQILMLVDSLTGHTELVPVDLPARASLTAYMRVIKNAFKANTSKFERAFQRYVMLRRPIVSLATMDVSQPNTSSNRS